MDAERAAPRARFAPWTRLALLAAVACMVVVDASPARGQVREQDMPVLLDDRSSPVPGEQTGTTSLQAPQSSGREARPAAPPLDIDLQSRIKDVAVTQTPAGPVVHVRTEQGLVELTPEEYVRAIGATQARVEEGGFLYRILNISRPWSLVWISVGLLGQLMFTLRMVLQWWASEKHKRSIIPVGFWWGSLFGGALLFAYFCWRKDIVGIIGQSTGVFIYVRNLVLIYRRKPSLAETSRPVEERGVDQPGVHENVAQPRAT